MNARTRNHLSTFVLAIVVLTLLGASNLARAQDDALTLVLITNVNVWDGTSDELAMGVDVLVEGLAALGLPRPGVPTPDEFVYFVIAGCCHEFEFILPAAAWIFDRTDNNLVVAHFKFNNIPDARLFQNRLWNTNALGIADSYQVSHPPVSHITSMK